MTGLEKWEEEEKKRIECKLKQGVVRIATDIYVKMYKCAYCKYYDEKSKTCLKDKDLGKDLDAFVCLEGIKEYLESEV